MALQLDHHRGGSGEPLLLVHGIGSTWRVWKPVLGALEARHEVLGVDLPGFGYSAPLAPGVSPTPAALADCLEQTLDDLGWERPHVAGHSLGGRLALELACRGRAASVVAIAPTGMWSAREREYVRRYIGFQRTGARALAPLADTLTSNVVGRTVALGPVTAKPWRADPGDAAEALKLFAAAPSFDAALEAMLADGPGNVAAIDCPVRIVWPSRDTLLFPRQGERFVRAIPGAELHRLAGTGHVPIGDDPEATAEAILGFSTRHSATRAAA